MLYYDYRDYDFAECFVIYGFDIRNGQKILNQVQNDKCTVILN